MTRAIWWIFLTLLRRSWLIIAGILLGLTARAAFPPTSVDPSSQVLNPSAKAAFDREWAPLEQPVR
jgi:hypothetical protein